MIQRLAQWDSSGVLWLCARRGSSVIRLMRILTRIGDGYFWGLLTIILALADGRWTATIVTVSSAFGLELTLYSVVKRSVSRLRPFVSIPGATVLIMPPDEYSFPSGHTAAACVMTTIVAAWYPMLLILMIPLTVGIGISRVYLGVHYPSDIAAGAVLGSASTGLALALLHS